MDTVMKSMIPVCIITGLFFWVLMFNHMNNPELLALGFFNNILIIAYMIFGSILIVVGLNICYEWVKEKLHFKEA